MKMISNFCKLHTALSFLEITAVQSTVTHKAPFVFLECRHSQLKYRKRPCISRTFFHKIEAKNRGCGLSMDTSVFGVLKNLFNIHKTS